MPPAMDKEARWKLFHSIETQIFGMLQKDSQLAFADVDTSLENFRLAGSRVIFSDNNDSSTEKVEVRLWEAVTLINSRYRKVLSKFDSDVQKKNQVEKRKLLKRYVDFLKTSQYFYKSFVQSLASRFDIPQLRKVAHSMQLNTLSAERRGPSAAAEANALLSCHSTLLRLGDLSRYRNVVRTKDRSWDPALSYYALANELCPHNGLAYNQMAVISVSDKDHLNALYYLYRALAINEPSPMAHNNLLLQIKKIQEEWTGSKQIIARNPATGTESLETWFIRLHSKLYKGADFAGHDELEHEILGQLQVILREKNITEVLNKLILINVGAEYFAGVRLTEAPNDQHFQAYRFYLRLNLRMFTLLLQMYQPELRKSDDDSAPDVTGQANRDNETFTALARRILPGLRLYSTWMLGRAAMIVEQFHQPQLTGYIVEMWKTYATTLSLIVSNYHADDLQEVEYLLEEDEETVGFKPFREVEDCRHYMDYDGHLKPCAAHPSYPADGAPQRSHPNAEMMSRVRDILRVGLQLSTNEMYPLSMVDGPAFAFVDPRSEEDQMEFETDNGTLTNGNDPHSYPIKSYNYDGPASLPEAEEDASDQHDQFDGTTPDNEAAQPQLFSRAPSPAQSESAQSMSMSGDMYRMVDDLTSPPAVKDFRRSKGTDQSQETSYGIHGTNVFQQHARGLSGSSLLGSGDLFFGNSPFAPLPGEVPSLGQDRRMSRLGRSPTQSASPPNAQTGGDLNMQWLSTNGSQAKSNTPLKSEARSTDPEVNRQKYEYRPTQNVPSSNFSDNSSIYNGTPAQINTLNWANVANAFGQGRVRGAYYTGGDRYPASSMMPSSIWDGSQPVAQKYMATPPGGQGG